MIDFEIYRMTLEDLSEVMVLEVNSHAHPWTKKNFEDSIESGYWVYTLKTKTEGGEDQLIGHAVLMPGVEELHLLNMTIAQDVRRQKVAQRTLKAMEPLALERGLKQLILEVRVGNIGAIALYESLGYKESARRKNYYPGVAGGREDAIIMAKVLID